MSDADGSNEAPAAVIIAPDTAVSVRKSTKTTLSDVVRSFLGGKATGTIREYKRDIEDFAAFLNLPDKVLGVVSMLAQDDLGHANMLAASWKAHMLEQKLSPATINRRLSALRALCRAMRLGGIIGWEVEVVLVPRIPFKDTKGPPLENIRKLLLFIDQDPRGELQQHRNRAIVWLLFGQGLRRSELCSINKEDFDRTRGILWILGKGRKEKEAITLSPQVLSAVNNWIDIDPRLDKNPESPFFCSLQNATFGHRLTGQGIYKIIATLCVEADIPTIRPHGFRHAAVTAALDALGGDIRAAQRFARHKDVKTTMIYDDNRQNLAAGVAVAVSDHLFKDDPKT